MPRFFVDGACDGDTIELTGDDAHHITRVLRMKPGEALTVCDGAGTDYHCTLTDTAGGTAVCRVDAREASCGEPDVFVTLYMALPKGDKMDFIVQKAVELGACRVVPYVGARSVSRPDGSRTAVRPWPRARSRGVRLLCRGGTHGERERSALVFV